MRRIAAIRCRLAGHNYGQHFNKLTRGGWPDEPRWCDRCGRDEP